jgi:hypothetical protein
VIKAYHRLLDLKEKYIDLDVLRALCLSVQNNLNDAYSVPINKQKQKILQLFGRITSLVAQIKFLHILREQKKKKNFL